MGMAGQHDIDTMGFEYRQNFLAHIAFPAAIV